MPKKKHRAENGAVPSSLPKRKPTSRFTVSHPSKIPKIGSKAHVYVHGTVTGGGKHEPYSDQKGYYFEMEHDGVEVNPSGGTKSLDEMEREDGKV